VGVLPPASVSTIRVFGSPSRAEIYVTVPIETSYVCGLAWTGWSNGACTGRLRDGSEQAQAAAEWRAIAAALYPPNRSLLANRGTFPSGCSSCVKPSWAVNVAALVVAGGVAVLLLNCVRDTAQLLLARSLRRAREVTIRAHWGASRTRLTGSFFWKAWFSRHAGASSGCCFGLDYALLVGLLPVRSPILESAHPDMRLFGFTLAAL